MTRMGTCGLAAVLAGTVLVGQQPAAGPRDDVRLEQAINREVIAGDIRGAIEQYRALAGSGDRVVAAQATLRLGQAYRRTGDPRATETLESALAFNDQPAVVAGAQTALGRTTAAQAPAARAPRTLMVDSESLNVEYPTISADGRFIAYTDYTRGDGNLMIRDRTTGLDRRVTNDGRAPGREVLEKSFSPSGRHVAYVWLESESGAPLEIRVVETAAGVASAPRAVLKDERVRYPVPYNWSADGRRLAVEASFNDNSSRIGFVTVDDGQFHVLRSLDWWGTSGLAISPDGAYLAYGRPAETGLGPDVYVVSTDGQQEWPVIRNPGRDSVVGWSADGRYLIVTIEKEGAIGLWAQPMRGGRANGAATLLHANLAGEPAGLTSAGDVLLNVNPSTRGFLQAAIDTAAGRIQATPAAPVNALAVDWSPDGASLAFLNEDRRRGLIVLSVQTTGTRPSTRDLVLKDMAYILEFRWTPDGQSFVVRGRDSQGAQRVLSDRRPHGRRDTHHRS